MERRKMGFALIIAFSLIMLFHSVFLSGTILGGTQNYDNREPASQTGVEEDAAHQTHTEAPLSGNGVNKPLLPPTSPPQPIDSGTNQKVDGGTISAQLDDDEDDFPGEERDDDQDTTTTTTTAAMEEQEREKNKVKPPNADLPTTTATAATRLGVVKPSVPKSWYRSTSHTLPLPSPLPSGWSVYAPETVDCGNETTLTIQPVWDQIKDPKKVPQFKLPNTIQELDFYNNFFVVKLFSVDNDTKAYFLRALPVIAAMDGTFRASFKPERTATRFLMKAVIYEGKLGMRSDLNHTSEHWKTVDVNPGILCENEYGPKGTPMLAWKIPLPTEFLLTLPDGQIVYPGDTLKVAGEDMTSFVIRPIAMTFKYFPKEYKHVTFNAIMTIYETIIKSPEHIDLTFNEALGGYEIKIKPIESGEYEFDIFLNFVHGATEPLQKPKAIVIGRIDEHIKVHTAISSIMGSPFKLQVNGVPLPVPGKHTPPNPRCTQAENLSGRWLWLPPEFDCHPPFCSGNRSKVIEIPNYGASFMLYYTGNKDYYVWAPYQCHYHLYSPPEIATCMKKRNATWIHVTGDSPVREFTTNLMMAFHKIDTEKFHHVDIRLDKNMSEIQTPIRMTYEFFHQVMYNSVGGSRDFLEDKKLLDHYNLKGYTSHLAPVVGDFNQDGKNSTQEEKTRPDIVVLSPGLIYSIWKLKFSDFQLWMHQFEQYMLSDASRSQQPEFLWYGGPYVHQSTLIEERPEITHTRMRKFNDFAVPIARRLGFKIVDVITPTASRYDSTWDGVHYSIPGNGEWNGPVSHMITQIMLNTLFAKCDIDI
eukprot:TRINITY_DN1752_c1_g1_i3.p1 TRINITY_DN1752_c1_g1~~TRINITY_DN1752_c1_g1_i3.p1  ORF type:complete len:812 (-),score=121.14 TRINITY_DN1752_c1_g1_i3:249-2684(-)